MILVLNNLRNMTLRILHLAILQALISQLINGSIQRIPRESPPFTGLVAATSLRFHDVEVPIYKFRGEDAELLCKYDPGDDPLYSVQWYKDDMEFFRYMFRNKPPRKRFPVLGVNVDLNGSNERRVILRNLTFDSTGSYRCEVSADAPHFRTYTNSSRMVVVEFPKYPPTISGAKLYYRVGELALLNCTSAKSHPAATLTWFINGEQADESQLKFYHKWIHKDDLESIQLILSFTVNASHFINGRLALKCQATVSTIYIDANEQDALMVNEPIILEKRENKIFVLNSAPPALSGVFGVLSPVLVGLIAMNSLISS